MAAREEEAMAALRGRRPRSGGARAAAGGGHGGAPAAEIPSLAAEIPSRGRAPRQPLLHHGPTSSRRQLPVVGPPHRGNRVLPPLPRSGHGQGFASRREKNPYLRPPWRPTHFGFAVWVSCWSAFRPRCVGILGLGMVMRRLLETALGCCMPGHFFYIYFFQNYFLQKYIFSFTMYRFIPLPPGRVVAGGLYVIKIYVLSYGGPYRPAGGGRLPPNIKAEVPLTCICSKQHP